MATSLKPVKLGGSGIKLKLGQSQQAVATPSLGNVVKSKPKPNVSSVFNTEDSEDSDEEIPPEARMKMRNIGAQTITSSGPNSFGKTKQGFTDCNRSFTDFLLHDYLLFQMNLRAEKSTDFFFSLGHDFIAQHL
jgi:hypothetical protein